MTDDKRTPKPWDARQQEIRDLLDRTIAIAKERGGVTDRELDGITQMAYMTFGLMEAINDAGFVAEADTQNAVLPLALTNLAVLIIRTMGQDPLTALSILISVFNMHSGIKCVIVRQNPDGTQVPVDTPLDEGTIRGAIDAILGRKGADTAPATDTPTAPADEPGTQDLVEQLMAAEWAKTIKVH